MHTFKADTGVVFHYNGDCEGDVIIVVDANKVELDNGIAMIHLDMKHLEALVFEKWRGKLIGKIEQLEGPELLTAIFSFAESEKVGG